MKTKHTPGPWTYNGDEMVWTVVISNRPHRTIEVEGRSSEEAIANAYLVAAAPDLLAALKQAIEDSSYNDGYAKLTMDTLDLIHAAIAKAEGDQS